MREVNTELLRYFHEPQLLVFRAAILWAYLSPYLRGVCVCVSVCMCVYIYYVAERELMASLPVICCYGPNNSGKSDRLLVYSACHGVERGRNKSKYHYHQYYFSIIFQ